MAENKWIIDGHHYTCPACKKTMAIVVNESDEGFDFCPFCGKRISGQMAENKMEQVDFWIRYFKEHTNTVGCMELDGLDCREVLALLQELADKKADKPNKMEQIAKMFSKELGEVFSVEFVKGSLGRNKNFASCCYFKADGLFCEDRGPCEIMLNDLLTGKAVIINE